MHPLAQFISALILTYFASRLVRRLPLGAGRTRRALIAHLIVFPVLVGALLLAHGFAGAIASNAILFLALAQVLWLVLDGSRAGSVKRKEG